MRPLPHEIQLREQQTYDLPSAPVASAAITLSLKRFRGSPAPGYVSSTLRTSGGRYTLPEPLPVSCARLQIGFRRTGARPRASTWVGATRPNPAGASIHLSLSSARRHRVV